MNCGTELYAALLDNFEKIVYLKFVEFVKKKVKKVQIAFDQIDGIW